MTILQPAAKSFLRQREKSLRSRAESDDPEESLDALETLGSILLLLGDTKEAGRMLQRAIQPEGTSSAGGVVAKSVCLMERVRRQLEGEQWKKDYAASEEQGQRVVGKKRIRQGGSCSEGGRYAGEGDGGERADDGAEGLFVGLKDRFCHEGSTRDVTARWCSAQKIETIDGASLNVSDFKERFAMKGVPVVLTGMVCKGRMFGEEPWTYQSIKESRCLVKCRFFRSIL